jgi:acetolactate synthase I/III small subunit
MRHILAALVQNNPGVLQRVSGLIRRRGFNIESLAVGVTDDGNLSRITLVVEGDETVVQQVQKQLYKLIEVLKVTTIDIEQAVHRELALIKVHADPARRSQIMQLCSIFRANVVDMGKKSMMIEVTGTPDKVEALIALAKEHGVQEVVRTGVIALERGSGSVKPSKEEPLHDKDVLRV